MFDNFKNMAGMMGQFKDMKQRMEQLQAELERKVVESDAGAGAVRVAVNGKMQVLSVRIDRAMLSTLAGPVGDGGADAQADQQLVEELIAAAVNSAMDKAKEMVASEMQELTGGMDIPGLDKLLGG